MENYVIFQQILSVNIEIEQQQKFIEEFNELVRDAPPRFKEKWDQQINFLNPTHQKSMPVFNPGAIDALSVALRDKYEVLRKKYYNKTL